MGQGGPGLSVSGVFVETKGNGNTDTHGECPRRGSQANVTGHLHLGRPTLPGPGPPASGAWGWKVNLRSSPQPPRSGQPPAQVRGQARGGAAAAEGWVVRPWGRVGLGRPWARAGQMHLRARNSKDSKAGVASGARGGPAAAPKLRFVPDAAARGTQPWNSGRNNVAGAWAPPAGDGRREPWEATPEALARPDGDTAAKAEGGGPENFLFKRFHLFEGQSASGGCMGVWGGGRDPQGGPPSQGSPNTGSRAGWLPVQAWWGQCGHGRPSQPQTVLWDPTVSQNRTVAPLHDTLRGSRTPMGSSRLLPPAGHLQGTWLRG